MKKVIALKKYRDFGFAVGILFPLLIGVFIPYLFGHDFRLWAFLVTFPLFGYALFCPLKLKYLYKFWIWLGNILGFFYEGIMMCLSNFQYYFEISRPVEISTRPILAEPTNKKSRKIDFFKIA